ncbi:MAG: extracellular solute-binding protein, partial [Peptostreptococcaceae bacterium]
MKKILKKLLILATTVTLTLSVVGCSSKNEVKEQSSSVLEKEYTQILEDAKGSTVNFYGYGGNEVMNKWFDTYVTKEMKEKYDITVNRVGMNIDEILNKLISEKQANSAKGTIDVVWLNGENFKVAKETGLLLGKFTQLLPNFNEYVDSSAPEINNDFGTEVENMEAPWGRAQFVVAYDSEVIKTPITDH